MCCVSFLEIKGVNNGPEPGLNAIPWMLAHSAAAFLNCQAREINLCSTCTNLRVSDRKLCQKRELQLLKLPAGYDQNLQYESSHEDCIIKEIFAMGNSKGSSPKTAAFLLCLCVQHSVASFHMGELRRLLLCIASGVQNTVWVSSGQVIGNASGW